MLAQSIQTLADFCGARSFPTLSEMPHVDVAVLFGGSILAGAECMAQVVQNRIADTAILVGGAGHTTQTLRDKMHALCPSIETDGRAEADIFQEYLKKVHGVSIDIIETESTNCGNNITNLLSLLEERHILCESILLMQDATMQKRMEATLRKYVSIPIYNFATYHAEIAEKDGEIVFANDILGMWDMDRFVKMLLGEVTRLTDDENGYGPNGKGYIAHVDIPQEVTEAFNLLRKHYVPREEWKM